MQALVMTNTTGSHAASTGVIPSAPCRFCRLAVTAALPKLPLIAIRRPVKKNCSRLRAGCAGVAGEPGNIGISCGCRVAAKASQAGSWRGFIAASRGCRRG